MVATLLVVVAVGPGAAPPAAAAWSGAPLVVSTRADGAPAATGGLYGSVSSGPDLKVAFRSDSPDLVPGDAGSTPDIFVKDVASGAVTRVGASIEAPYLSADGRHVAYSSPSGFAVPGASGFTDTFVKDLRPGAVTLVSARTDGGDGLNSGSESLARGISADGSKVLFRSNTGRVLAGVFHEAMYVRDLATGTTVAASVAPSGETFESFDAALSPNGRFVAFSGVRAFTGLGEPRQVYLRDLTTSTTTLVSATPSSAPGAGPSTQPAVSDFGDVAFVTSSPDLVPGDDNGADDVVVAAPGRAAELVSVSTDGARLMTLPPPAGPAAGTRILQPSLSRDGRLVAFATEAGTLVPGDVDAEPDVFLRDRVAETTTLVSTPNGRPTSNGYSHLPRISPDGTAVVFDSSADDLSARPLPGTSSTEVFVTRVTTPTLPAAAPPAVFVPLAPARLVEAVPAGPGGVVPVFLAGTDVPAGATAIAVNVTASGVSERTVLSACPGDAAVPACRVTSTVNPYPRRDVANSAVTRVGPLPGGGSGIYVHNSVGSALVSVDLTGYFIDAHAADPTAADFRPVAPRRIAGPLSLGGGEDALVGLDAVPTGASAAAIRVTVSGVTANTYVSVCRAEDTTTTCARSSTVNAWQRDASNLALVPLGERGAAEFKVYNNRGGVLVQVDVVGFFVPQGTGSTYRALPPTRVLSSEFFGETGEGLRRVPTLPGTATAVLANVTTAGNTATTYLSVCPGDVTAGTCSRTSTVNSYPGQDTASTTMSPVDARGALRYYNNRGDTLVFTDLQGWFAPR